MKPPGSTRCALAAVVEAGFAGTYCALAAAAGVPPDRARATLKEMRRCGQVGARRTHGGHAPAVYARPPTCIDPLAFVREAWR